MKEWLLLSYFIAASAAVCSAASVTVDPVFSVSGAPFDSLPTSRFATFAMPGDSSQVTHLVTTPFRQIGAGPSARMEAQYSGVNGNAANPSVLEKGLVVLEPNTLPGAPDGTVSSGIIAVIPRVGAWDQSRVVPAASPLANVAGTESHSDLSISLSLSGPTFSGSAGYAVIDRNLLQLAPFSLRSGGTAYSFSGGWLETTGNGGYSGILLSDAAVDIDSVAYVLRISGTEDADGDGTPDLTDADGIWYAPYTVGERGLVVSDWFGAFWLTGNNMLYHEGLRWLYGTSKDDWLVAYHYAGLGWIATNAGSYPYIFCYAVPTADGAGYESGWAYLGTETGGENGTWVYFLSGSRATSGTEPGLPGWWRF